MQRAIDIADFLRQEKLAHASFNVLIAYEDFESGKHAKRTYDFLSQNLASEFALASQMWKFDVLSIPKLAEIAAQDAQSADIVIVSCRGTDELPEHVRRWIESWVKEGTRAQALVALFQGSEPWAQGSIGRYLADVARRANLEYFQQPESCGGILTTSPANDLRPLEHSQARTGGTLAGAMARDYPMPRWGINE